MKLGPSVLRVPISAARLCYDASVAFVGHSFNPIVQHLPIPTCYKPKVYLTQGGLLIVFHGSTHQVQPHQQRSDSPPPPTTPPPPRRSSSLSYFRELGGDQSLVGRYVLLQAASLWRLRPLQHLLFTSGWMDGVVLGGGGWGWGGAGFLVARQTIGSDAGWSFGGR